MPLYLLDDKIWFPPVEKSMQDGLLAIGGDLSVERLLLAYQSGIFPWFNEEDPPLWWSPDPRFVLFPNELKVSKSMKQIIRKQQFEFRSDTVFSEVIAGCRTAERKGMDGTWITDDIVNSYTELHRQGYVHCAEAWENGELAGGLYGVLIGKAFFGESMFSRVSNASKFAFIMWVEELKRRGVELIDCQVYTSHLQSLGARMIPRRQFMSLLSKYIC